MFNWPWRYSGADGDLCTNNGCIDDWCMCQVCPICDMAGREKRVPLIILQTKSQFTRGGQWVGPHCIICDMEIYFGRNLSPGPDEE